jgi:multisubunit Na+/H+ antiporter MnhC subunit
MSVCALYGAIAATFCAPLFERPHALGVSDWDQHLFYYGSVLVNIIEYGQWPFWNPWYCGGNVLWQNPQVALLSPVYPLTPLMSLALAMKVNILLHYWVGFIGMHLILTRILGLFYLPIVVYLASVFTLAGSLALHLNAGHSVFLPAFYLPLLLFFFLRSLRTESVRDALVAGATLALMVFNGGLHIVPIALVAVGGIGVVAAAVRRTWRPLALSVLIGVAGFSYAAPKLVPVILFVTGDQFWDTRTGTELSDRMTVPILLRAYLDPYQTRSLRVGSVQRHGWYEYGNYMGALAVILTASSTIWVFAARNVRDRWLGLSLAVTAVLLLALSAGEFSRFAPSEIAARLPLFSSFRIPSRYTVGVALLAALTIGWVARSIALDHPLTGSARLFVGVVCTVAMLQLLLANRAQFGGVFSVAPLDRGFHLLAGPETLVTDRATSPYGPNSPMLRALVAGQSFYNCYESLQLLHAADADHPIVFSDGKSKIFEARFSPNRIQFSVANGREPSRIFLNQNYASGWRSSAGPVTADPQSGMPSVELPPGQTGRFWFAFAPPGLGLGLGVLAGAVVASVVLWSRRLGSRLRKKQPEVRT